MKKLVSLILAMLMLLSLSACGKQEAPAPQTEAPVVTEAPAAEAPAIEAATAEVTVTI